MAIVKTKTEINIARESGRRLAAVLYKVIERAAPGVTPRELDAYAEKLIREGGDEPAFLGYKPAGAKREYPATLCVSVNNEVVHGIPKSAPLQSGDIVALDIGLSHQGFITDMARTIAVTDTDQDGKKLMRATEEALWRGISAAKARGHVGDIGYAVESYINKTPFALVRELGGHAVGKRVHEEPYIPNRGKKGVGAELVPGMVLAIEPIVNEGEAAIYLDEDGYTYKTKDGKRSAHFEDTILVTENEAEILTKM